VVRVDETTGSHCINAKTERVTVFVRRVFVEKRGGLFTEDNKAGVLVRVQLGAKNTAGQGQTDPTVQIPSVNMISVKDAANGRVSLALEYAVASDFELTQDKNVTTTMDLFINLARTRSRNSFGEALDLAGSALQLVTLPSNPFVQMGSKFLKFANDTVNSSINSNSTEEIAHIASKFKQGPEPSLDRCKANGNERTGVLAALRSTGASGQPLIPMTNTDRDYCFKYSSGTTFELLAAKRQADGSCPAATSFSAVMNDYVMLLMNAELLESAGKGLATPEARRLTQEAMNRCTTLGLDKFACGVK